MSIFFILNNCIQATADSLLLSKLEIARVKVAFYIRQSETPGSQ